MSRPSVSSGYAGGLLAFAVSRGADRSRLLERSGIDPEALDDLDRRIAFPAYVALMREAKALTGDEALALHFAEVVAIESVSIVGLISQASGSMRDAFIQLNRYVRLIVDVGDGTRDRFEMVVAGGEPWLVDTRPNPNDFPELTESALAQLAFGPRRVGVPPFVKTLHVTHAEPSYRAEYERIFAAPVVFEAEWNGFQVERAVVNRDVAPILPRYAFGVLTDRADALLAELDGSESARGRVEDQLMPILHTGDASMTTIASRLGVSRQTLFRQLRAEGVTFERVIDELRHRLAIRYLSGSKVSVNETAYLVGFSDPASFSRAFKRWTGVSPRAARAARR
jgi:AraC-like DNA-binding protein